MSKLREGLTYRGYSLSSAGLLGILYLAGATVYGVLAFRNFATGEVVATLFLFSALPIGLILFSAGTRPTVPPAKYWAVVVLAGAVALVMFVFQFSGFTYWEGQGYFSNFPNQRMELGGGFHPDTVFHVAIIQGVLNTGYPTTGQHLEPWASYHTLSHYVDAVALWLLAIDPWESYALLFFAKGVGITLSLIYFAMKVAEPHSRGVFWLVLLTVYPAFTAIWLVIGSHGQWLPMTVLALSAHHVFVIGMKNRRNLGDYAVLTFLVIVLSLGKISLGFGLAVVVGFWLFFRRPFDWRLIVTGVVWVAFLGFFSSTFGARVGREVWTLDLSGLLGLAYHENLSVFLIVILSAMVARITKLQFARSFSASLAVSFVVIVLATGIFGVGGNDRGYFFHGLFSVALLLAVPILARGLLNNPGFARNPVGSEKLGLRLLAFVASLLFALSPVVFKEYGTPQSNLQAALATVVATFDHTYFWYNKDVEPEERLNIWQALLGKDPRVEQPAEIPYASQLRDSLKDFVEENNIVNESPLLYITAEQFEAVATQFSNPNPMWTGLSVTAVTGLPLAFGVPDSDFPGFGFSDYDESALVMRENVATFEVLCSLGRPVIIAVEIANLNFMLACHVE